MHSNGPLPQVPILAYNNPQLFPQMMPWLFPYGLGGIGNKLQKGHISDIAHNTGGKYPFAPG